MNKYTFLTAGILLLATTAFTWKASQSWTIIDNYEVKFTSEDPSGVFTSLKGDVVFHPEDLSSSYFNMTIDVKSINTGNGMQNQHAVSAEWMDAEKYPEIKFASRNIEATDKGYVAHGKLKMHGVEKDFDIPFKFEKNGSKGVFKGKFDVNRNDFNIGVPGKKASDVLHMEVTVPVSTK
ncbi:MAG TPA: polyisoprenoid-binding protein [Bacteroidetes bacterium]|jgi:polyisoprenoid-binding protein YceI|nr:MAG: hypothetical protein ABR95_02900 [Sphingobacteriales bacterium BACL12 MAG-120813-bin55]HCK22867.1 polyisoprenoid-binding protein [Bacteroidota bacterium]